MTTINIAMHPLLPDITIENKVFCGLTLSFDSSIYPGWGTLFTSPHVTVRNCTFYLE
jgi:hypothetical protein